MAWTLAAPCRYEQEIKKSRFLAFAAHAPDIDTAMTSVADHSDGDARHNCWAYRIGNTYRWDDGDEPAGTAGKPILAAIDGQQLDQVIVLVTRWFGGIKLGAGGLVRAYGRSAAECLRIAVRRELITYETLHLRVAFDALGNLHACMHQFEAIKREESYDADGVLALIDVRRDRADGFWQALRDATRGTAVRLNPPL